MKLDRVSNLTIEEFVSDYMIADKPIVITDGMESWRAKTLWTPEFLAERYGDVKVQVYNDLFMLVGIRPLKVYFEHFFNKDETSGEDKHRPGYVRWYTRLKDEDRVPWADDVFAELAADWSMPYFLPRSGYLLPYCSSTGDIDPNSSPFPARGLFISGRGARTALHKDPWGSDAVLCQMYGRKRFYYFEPDQEPYLTNEEGVAVDLDAPDLEKFPDFEKAKPAFVDELEPGEMVYVPHGWYHQFDTLTDSISLTWNFVHMSTWRSFYKYLASNPSQEELDTISYFVHDIPGRETDSYKA